MKQREIPKPGEFYRHFKMKYYQIITVATHTETEEQMVIYQALYDDFGIYARPLTMFLSEVDSKKYPDAVQTYRFERVDSPCASEKSEETVQRTEQPLVFEEKKVSEEKQKNKGEEEYVMDQDVERFLDADTYKAKLDILMSLRSEITDKQLHDMAITLDVTIEDGALDDKFMNLVNCLRTMARFEVNR